MDWYFYALIGALVAVWLTAPLIHGRLQEFRLNRAGLGDPGEMTDEAMAHHLYRLFTALGYRVYRPDKEEGDFDLIAKDGLGQWRGVLLRHWRRIVDEEVVRQASEAAGRLESAPPLIVSVKGFTAPARAAARETEAVLWGLRELTEAIDRVREVAAALEEGPDGLTGHPGATPDEERARHLATIASGGQVTRSIWVEPKDTGTPKEQEPLPEPDPVPTCPRCGRRMVPRRSRRERYWGCPAFPRCLGIRPREETGG